MTRRFTKTRLCLAVLISAMLLLTGCAKPAATTTSDKSAASAIRIGTLATEDSLPLWVAQERGYFAVNGVSKVDIITFQSAQERDTAFASGAIDAFMGDIIAAASLEASGKDVEIATIMLGTDRTQGRFGIAVPPKSKVATLPDLAGVPIGTSSDTIQEYVLDGLMTEAGVPADKIKTVEVKKVPVRYELLMAGKLKAAALPEPFLSLASQNGAFIVGDDTKSSGNISQTILGVSGDFAKTPAGKAAVSGVLRAWNAAAAEIDADPTAYRQMLIEKARLPKPLADTYRVNKYPQAVKPTNDDVLYTLIWMKRKGYLKTEISPQDLLGTQF